MRREAEDQGGRRLASGDRKAWAKAGGGKAKGRSEGFTEGSGAGEFRSRRGGAGKAVAVGFYRHCAVAP